MPVHDFFPAAGPDLPGLASHLDALPEAERIREARSLTAREQAVLFEAARGFRSITTADFVPEGTAPFTEVIHHGRNSLLLFRLFEKRFCRAPSGELLLGYNEQAMRWATGPGYFVARQQGPAEVLIDYLEVPEEHPPAWPAIRRNSRGISRFIYYRTQDLMRGVSRHVSIGRASRGGKDMDNWFVLCREDGAAKV